MGSELVEVAIQELSQQTDLLGSENDLHIEELI